MITGVILAGGQNRRMNGKMKALLSLGEETILQRQIQEMYPICEELILVTNHPQLFSTVKNIDHIITDNIPGKGPLSGMHAAFSFANKSELWVVACDMPFISHRAAQLLLEQKKKADSGAAIPVIDGKMHPLHGVYKKSIGPQMEEALAEGEFSVKSFLNRIQWCEVNKNDFLSGEIDSSFVTNVNTPDEYKLLLNKKGD